MDAATRNDGRARRRDADLAEPLIAGALPGYADAFEISLDPTDGRTSEEFARYALEQAPRWLRWFIWNAHRYLLGFTQGPRSSPQHLFGWTIRTSEPDVVQLEAISPYVRGVIVGRRPAPSYAVVTTYVFYTRPRVARMIMTIVAPIHRRVATYLMERSAAAGKRA